jgi:predicted phage terminase large subunit-like protein
VHIADHSFPGRACPTAGRPAWARDLEVRGPGTELLGFPRGPWAWEGGDAPRGARPGPASGRGNPNQVIAEYRDGTRVVLDFSQAGPGARVPDPGSPRLADAAWDADSAAGRSRALADLGLRARRAELLASLWEFVKASWKIVEPEQELTENWHLVRLCRVLEDVTAGLIRRLIINVPPGTLKSLLVSVFWPAWAWARKPGLRFLTASYGAHLTTRDNLKSRDIVTSPWYQRLFPLGLVEDQNTKTRYNTDRGGWRIATSVGGVGTGEHPDVIIIDDPTTADQAASKAERDAANRWFDRTISSRGITRPGLAIVVIMQRLHEDDLSGHLLRRGGCDHVRWPMRFERCECLAEGGLRVRDLKDPAERQAAVERVRHEDRCAVHKADVAWQPDAHDPRTEPGELLIPALIPEDKVRQLELDLGPYGAAGQLQQRPAPEGGGLFKLEWFKYIDSVPADDPVVRAARGWDTAASEGKGDWTRGVKIGETRSGKFVVFPPAGGQLSPDGVDKLILAVARMDGPSVAQREEKEGGAAGKAVVEARAKLLKGHDYAGVVVSGSKVTRSKPFRAQVEAGNVYLVRGEWNAEYTTELCAFPTGKHDDYVDASGTAFNAVLLEPYGEVRVRQTVVTG